MASAAGLSPQAWADAALGVIAADGLQALNVEALARRLDVTKGSFYWHFSSRSALLLVALARWEKSVADRLRQDLDAIGEPRVRLRRLLWRGEDPLLDRLGSSPDANVRRTLDRLRDRRLELIARTYAELGVDGPAAQARSALAFAAYVGLTQLDPADAERVTELLLSGVGGP